MVVAVVLGGEGQVDSNHFHCAVTEEALQGVGVAAVSEEVDGKGMTKAVDIGAGDFGAGSDVVDKVVESVTVKGALLLGDK